MTERYDAVVVGAGPAGAATAACLARRGAKVALLDKKRFPREKLCGGFVSAEGVWLLESMGIRGLPPCGRFEIIERLVLTTPAGRSVEAPLSSRFPSGHAWGVSRHILDEWMVRAAELAGADLFTGMEAARLERDGARGWSVEARLPSSGPGAAESAGAALRLHAPLLIAADGANSRIGRLLAKGQAAGRKRRRPSRVFGFQSLYDAPAMRSGTVEIHFFPGGYLGLQRVGSGLTNACGIVDPLRAGVITAPLDALIEQAARGNPAARRRLAGAKRVSAWQAVGGLRFGPLSPVRCGAFFVGDASGTIEPFTGEGIAMALASAALLSRATGLFLEGKAGLVEAQLAYARDWRRAFLRRLQLCRLLRQLAACGPLLEAGAAAMGRRPSLARALFLLTRTRPAAWAQGQP